MTPSNKLDDVPPAEEYDDSNPLGSISDKKPPRPSQCRTFVREAVAESMPVIVDAFVSKAIEGSVPHLNLLTKFGRSSS